MTNYSLGLIIIMKCDDAQCQNKEIIFHATIKAATHPISAQGITN